MKVLLIISVLLCASNSSGLSIPKITSYVTLPPIGDQLFLEQQKALLQLVQHPHQRDVYPRLLVIANGWKIEENIEQYTNINAVKEFLLYYNHGLIGPDELFNIYDPVHRNQVIALYNLLFCARNWQSLYKTLVWARLNVNAGQFIYALMMVSVHRNDLKGLTLPPIYEINPYLFFPSDVIQCAQTLKQQGFHNEIQVDGVYHIFIQSNYTADKMLVNEEQCMSYYREDIGLNAYNFNLHIGNPFWLGGGSSATLSKCRRGESYLFELQQLMSRYNLERSSNNLDFVWEKPIESGYYPSLRTYQGYPFVSREGQSNYHRDCMEIDSFYLNEFRLFTVADLGHVIEDIEDIGISLRNAIDSGFIFLPNGTFDDIRSPESIDKLGNLIQGNPESVNLRFYRYAEAVHRTLGRTFGKNQLLIESVYPSILQHPETQLRDPFYWQWLNRVNMLWWKFKENLQPYTMNEIGFAGVRIDAIKIGDLFTYFSNFDADITNAVDIEPPTEPNASELYRFGRISQQNGHDFVIKARQRRLNYVPFQLTVFVSSMQKTPCVVRIYLGPKYTSDGFEFNINENRRNFVLLDAFKYDLDSRDNVIVRNSRDFTFQSSDRTAYFELYKWLMSATKGERSYTLADVEPPSGFPKRLLLPKGKECGQIYQLFVAVSPFRPSLVDSIGPGTGWIDSMSLGYPLDRHINELIWPTSNMRYQDVNIFHKNFNDINLTSSVGNVSEPIAF